MPTVQEMAAQLVGEIPGLPFLFAKNYINQSLADVSQDYLWSWNVQEGEILVPQIITTGAVSVTQFSNALQFDTQARAALDPQALANPALTTRQFRVGGGPIYNLISYDTNTGIGALDRLYAEGTSATATYSIYRCYYGPPTIDGNPPTGEPNFLRYLSILDPINGYCIAGKRLYLAREALNRRDPMRGSLGQMLYASPYRPSPNTLNSDGTIVRTSGSGQMQYEFWPHPTAQQQLQGQYALNALQLNINEYLPAQCPANIIRYKAKEFAIRWAMSNMGRVPELKGVNWPLALTEILKEYNFHLVGAKRNDKEILLTILRPGSAGIMDFFGPIDSNWAQSHGVASFT